MSSQKFKYLDNERTFQDEIKRIFHHFQRVFIEPNKKKNTLEGESPTLNSDYVNPSTLSALVSLGPSLANVYLSYHEKN